MTVQELERVIEWLERSKNSVAQGVQLMGGEPLLHPGIEEIIDRLKSSGLEVKAVLTNGIIETETVKNVKNKLPATKFLVNVDQPDKYSQSDWERLTTNLEILSKNNRGEPNGFEAFHQSGRCELSLTFTGQGQNFEYILDLAEDLGVSAIRYDFSRPGPGGENDYLKFEQLRQVKEELIQFIGEASARNIYATSDCALPPCIFTVDEWKFLTYYDNSLRSVCKHHLDISPDLNVAHCASTMREFEVLNIRDHSVEEVLDRHWREADRLRELVVDRCKGCEFHSRNICQGYCLRLKAIEARNEDKID